MKHIRVFFRYSDLVLQHFSEGTQRYSGGFSVDGEDLFYSMPHDKLSLAVMRSIDENDET